jgi:hypothetical protein
VFDEVDEGLAMNNGIRSWGREEIRTTAHLLREMAETLDLVPIILQPNPVTFLQFSIKLEGTNYGEISSHEAIEGQTFLT